MVHHHTDLSPEMQDILSRLQPPIPIGWELARFERQ